MTTIYLNSKSKPYSDFKKQRPKHKAFDTLSEYDLMVCAEILGCSLTHLRNVLLGYVKYTHTLNINIMNLKEQLENAEKKERKASSLISTSQPVSRWFKLFKFFGIRNLRKRFSSKTGIVLPYQNLLKNRNSRHNS